ncbi:MAG: 30S ribosomal protein S2, partial [Gammaproteobacteria bacterium]|nr:30S ribosomal protein S2 [Gammaproteobacteria bacterium]
MKSIPDALFIIDVGYEDIAVKEAIKLNIPIIAVVDTNNSFDNIDYFFPGNDDSMRAIDLYCTEVSNAIKKGQEFLKTQ